MFSSHRWARLWFYFILICSAFFIMDQYKNFQTPIETNIFELLPKNENSKISQFAFDAISNNLSNKAIFLLGSSNKEKLIDAAGDFSIGLEKISLFKEISAKVSIEDQNAYGDLYYKYKDQLLSKGQKERLKNSPSLQTKKVIQSIYDPFSGVTGTELQNDPFLLFREYLSSKSKNQFSLLENYLSVKFNDATYILISADLKASAYDPSNSKKLAKLELLKVKVKDKYQISLDNTGVLFYSSYGINSAQKEISTIGIGSIVGIIVLLLFVYRSALPIFLALLSISVGLFLAFIFTYLIFGKVHLFTLVFGASLIGVSIDYTFHFLTNRLSQGVHWNSKKGLQEIFPAITLGLITSLIGYLGMFVTSFSGLQQLSIFSSIGLLSAYLTVVCWYPLFAKKASLRTIPDLALFRAWLDLWKRKSVKIAIPLAFILIMIIGLFHVHFDDDVRQLQALPTALKTQESFIKSVTKLSFDKEMLLVTADNEEELLQKIETVDLKLSNLVTKGHLTEFQTIAQNIPSVKTQFENFRLVSDLFSSQKNNLMGALSLKTEVSISEKFTPLLMEEYLASSVSKQDRFLWLGEIEGKFASIILLKDLKSIEFLTPLLEDHDLLSLNKAREVSTIFASYRVKITILLFCSYFLIGCFLLCRYGFKKSFLILSPPMIAGGVGLAITGLIGIPFTIFNLLGLILILGIGIDYTLFFAEEKDLDKEKSTFYSISLSALTTILSFGLLALSETAAIKGFGITIFIGIFVAWLLSPMANVKKGNEK